MLLVDSREKWTQSPNAKPGRNVRSWLEAHHVDYAVRKLDVGDYMLEGGRISVDRKGSLQELATNLMNRSDSARFWREVRRAKATFIQLVILVECGHQYKTVRDVTNWKSQYSHVSGRRLADEMIRLELSYGVQFRFCDKRVTGKHILEILNGGET